MIERRIISRCADEIIEIVQPMIGAGSHARSRYSLYIFGWLVARLHNVAPSRRRHLKMRTIMALRPHTYQHTLRSITLHARHPPPLPRSAHVVNRKRKPQSFVILVLFGTLVHCVALVRRRLSTHKRSVEHPLFNAKSLTDSKNYKYDARPISSRALLYRVFSFLETTPPGPAESISIIYMQEIDMNKCDSSRACVLNEMPCTQFNFHNLINWHIFGTRSLTLLQHKVKVIVAYAIERLRGDAPYIVYYVYIML